MSTRDDGYLGKDGKRYDSIWAVNRADRVVEEQEEQTRLLETQAKLEILRAQQEQKRMQQEKELELERQEHEKQLEIERQEHEEEMRLLKILDSLSIPLAVYEKFEKDLFTNNNSGINEKDLQKEKELTEKLLKMSADAIEKAKNNIEKKSEVNVDFTQNKVKYEPKHIKLESFVNGNIDYQQLNENDIDKINYGDKTKERNDAINNAIRNIKETLETVKKEKHNQNGALGWAGCTILMFFISPSLIFLWIILLIFELGSWYSYKEKSDANVTNLKKMINAAIDFNAKSIKSKEDGENIDKISSEFDEISKKNNAIRNANINKKLQYVYEFRKNHYNIQIEKLFFDVGLIEECNKKGVIFKNIDKSEIIEEGTYEDYFLFFSNFSSSYQEYENSLQ